MFGLLVSIEIMGKDLNWNSIIRRKKIVDLTEHNKMRKKILFEGILCEVTSTQ